MLIDLHGSWKIGCCNSFCLRRWMWFEKQYFWRDLETLRSYMPYSVLLTDLQSTVSQTSAPNSKSLHRYQFTCYLRSSKRGIICCSCPLLWSHSIFLRCQTYQLNPVRICRKGLSASLRVTGQGVFSKATKDNKKGKQWLEQVWLVTLIYESMQECLFE